MGSGLLRTFLLALVLPTPHPLPECRNLRPLGHANLPGSLASCPSIVLHPLPSRLSDDHLHSLNFVCTHPTLLSAERGSEQPLQVFVATGSTSLEHKPSFLLLSPHLPALLPRPVHWERQRLETKRQGRGVLCIRRRHRHGSSLLGFAFGATIPAVSTIDMD